MRSRNLSGAGPCELVLSASLATASFAGGTCELNEALMGDAGELPASATVALGFGELCAINGWLSAFQPAAADYADVYLIRITDPGLFMARTVPVGGGEIDFDTQLWLFSACGLGLLGNDDCPTDGRESFSCLLDPRTSGGAPLTPGLYYLAISGFDNDPHSESGPIFLQKEATEISGPDGPGGGDRISSWTGFGTVGPYRIELEGAAFVQPGVCLADVDGDSAVDAGDLITILVDWGPCLLGACPADLNGDGFVGVLDLSLVIAFWGECEAVDGVECGDPRAGSCLTPHDNPGCDDPCCCEAVCAADPACCELEWDQTCAAAAGQCTLVTTVVHDLCSDALEVGVGAWPVSTVGATVSGPPLPILCAEGATAGIAADVWLSFAAPATGVVSVSTCDQANFDTRLAAYMGDCSAPLLIACDDDALYCEGGTSKLSFVAVAGETYLLRVGGAPGPSGEGSATVTVQYTGLADCPSSTHGCNVIGGPGCSDKACCDAVCGLLPTCCVLGWDVACVALAQIQCPD